MWDATPIELVWLSLRLTSNGELPVERESIQKMSKCAISPSLVWSLDSQSAKEFEAKLPPFHLLMLLFLAIFGELCSLPSAALSLPFRVLPMRQLYDKKGSPDDRPRKTPKNFPFFQSA